MLLRVGADAVVARILQHPRPVFGVVAVADVDAARAQRVAERAGAGREEGALLVRGLPGRGGDKAVLFLPVILRSFFPAARVYGVVSVFKLPARVKRLDLS